MFEKVKNKFAEIKTNFSTKMLAVPASAAALATTLSVSSFASEGEGVATEFAKIAITEEMLAPLTQSVADNLAVILPTGIVIMGLMIGVRLAPSVFSRFMRM